MEGKTTPNSSILRQIAQFQNGLTPEEQLIQRSLDLFGQLYFDLNNLWEGVKKEK